ncbi:deoxyribonuclease [Roseivirga seohaensis]|uniref:Deoxyribonuclease n=1 Tax=Roseivirga seohaensis TaxID=1914963 RepID=A0A150XZ38_9BACT|nr:Qat anti-phage system TatD family nuclease QatD [Roseivirga seohaensis]KYG83936.1 deoxyribonuclease [Roseivirga seohaensis]
MIDTHCHIDLYPNPERLLKKIDRAQITVIGMTNLPSHFEMGFRYVRPYKKIRLALGMHPLHADQHQHEFDGFLRLLQYTSYIGEVGLDFSYEGIRTKDIQIASFKRILNSISGERKILSIHSRKAESQVYELLIDHNIQSAIFHWYSGPLKLIDKISESGFYFSINPAMIKSRNGQKIVERIPLENVLTETDGPFIENDGVPIEPENVSLVLDYLASTWKCSIDQAEKVVDRNFSKLINYIR